jgi:subtilisin family serine protease
MHVPKYSVIAVVVNLLIVCVFLMAFEKQPLKEIFSKFQPEVKADQVDSLTSALGLTKVKSISEINVDVFKISSNMSVSEVVQVCSTLPFVVYAEPSAAVRTFASPVASPRLNPSPAFQPQAQTAEFRPGEVIVKFRTGIQTAQATNTLSTVGIQVADRYNEIGVLRCTVSGGKAVLTAIAECNADPSIEYAEPNYIYRTSIDPNDPRFSSLYGMRIIGAPDAWETQTGSQSVIVGVIDTGIDGEHEDLQANMWTNQGESGGGKENNNVDDDGNGFVDDFRGWDFINNDNNPFDDNDHGTHVSGTVGAAGNNSTGVVGVNWNVKLMPLKFLGGDGSGSSGDAIDAIIYGTNMGAKVLNNSWGGGGRSQALEDAIKFANDRGVLFVAAAGNESSDNDRTPSFPANYEVENVISVAASTSSDNIASFSNTGEKTVHLAAPGSGILSTEPRNRYQSLNGTSMATPHVSGAAALVWAQFPSITMSRVKIRLLGSVDRNNSFLNEVITDGRLNVNRAISTNPIIANTTQLENTLNEAGPYVVEADVIDDVSVANVTLNYQVVGQSVLSLPMTALGNDRYRGAIPGQSLGTSIAYFVKATDGDGNETQDATFSFSIDQPPDQGCGCARPVIDISFFDPQWQSVANGVANISLFVLPVLLNGTKRIRKKERK